MTETQMKGRLRRGHVGMVTNGLTFKKDAESKETHGATLEARPLAAERRPNECPKHLAEPGSFRGIQFFPSWEQLKLSPDFCQ